MNKTMPQRHKERLASAIKNMVRDIEDHLQEIELIEKVEGVDITPAKKEFIDAIMKDAIDDAKASLKNGYQLIECYTRIK